MLEIKMDRWYENENKYYAVWNMYPEIRFDLGIKGSPMGRGSDQSSAILDLIKRTNQESNTAISIADVVVIN